MVVREIYTVMNDMLGIPSRFSNRQTHRKDKGKLPKKYCKTLSVFGEFNYRKESESITKAPVMAPFSSFKRRTVDEISFRSSGKRFY